MSTLYKDHLIEVTEQEVVFHRYYFPFGGDKHVPLNQIESVQVRQPSITFGSWRIWGGGPSDLVSFGRRQADPRRNFCCLLTRSLYTNRLHRRKLGEGDRRLQAAGPDTRNVTGLTICILTAIADAWWSGR